MRRALPLILLPLSVAAIACGDAIDPITGGEGDGQTGFSVLITDDPANDPSPGGARSPGAPQAITGELVGAIRVALRNDAGALVDLGITQDVELALQDGGDSISLDVERPTSDNYVGIQLRFEGMTVTVFDGSEVGDSTLTSDATLDVGNGGLATVEVTLLPFDITSESEIDIVVDLNSELWITLDNIDDAVVPQADLASNLTVEIP